MDSKEQALDLGEEGKPSPQPVVVRKSRKTTSSAPGVGVELQWGEQKEKSGFALRVLCGVGIAFGVSAVAYVVLVVTGFAAAAQPFSQLITGVIPTLAGTVAGYILHGKAKG